MGNQVKIPDNFYWTKCPYCGEDKDNLLAWTCNKCQPKYYMEVSIQTIANAISSLQDAARQDPQFFEFQRSEIEKLIETLKTL